MTPEEEANLSPEGRAELDKIREVRGYTLPVHEYLAQLDPEMLKRYGALASYTLFGEEEGRPMDLKTRFLVLVGVTTACKGDREGVEWAAVRAIQNGATWKEVYEAAFMAALPAGIPAFEASCRAFDAMKQGDTWVDIEVPK